MGFQANVLKVMIASPGDVAEERTIVTEEIHRWNSANADARKLVLLPVKWETHSTPQLGDHPQTIINRQLLDEADIVVGIFGTRIGTRTEKYVSGTVEEIKRHVAAGKTAKVYFSDVPVSPSMLDQPQYEALKLFQEECKATGLYAIFNTAQELRTDFSHHLNLELNQARYLWLTAPKPSLDSDTGNLDPDSLSLLKASASASDGTAILQEGIGFYGLQVGDLEFMQENHRSAAKWRRIMKNLVNLGLFERLGEGTFRITDAGYEMADRVEASERSSQSTEISLEVMGKPDAQFLSIKSNHLIALRQLDFLISTGARIATHPLTEEGTELQIKIPQDKVAELHRAPRPDRDNNDLSGPAKLRLLFRVNGNLRDVVLPVVLRQGKVGNTFWVTLSGAEEFQIPNN